MLAFADEGRAGQHDGQHRDVVDDLDHTAEPGSVELRVEARPQDEIDRGRRGRAIALDERRHLIIHDRLDITAAGECLAHARGIDIELNGGAAAGQHVLLEFGRDIERKSVESGIHACVHRPPCDDLRGEKIGRIESRDDPIGKG